MSSKMYRMCRENVPTFVGRCIYDDQGGEGRGRGSRRSAIAGPEILKAILKGENSTV